MSTPSAVAVAAALVWLGMVLAISFLEAPLKFRAPGVTVQVGVGIGRLVFRALNAVEGALAAVLLVGLVLASPSARATAPAVAAVALLTVRVALVRPRLARRSDRVIAGQDAPRSRGHYAYVALETLKVAALLVAGAALLAG